MNGKSERRRDAETGILKSETETENFSDLIEKHICDQTDAKSETPRPITRFRDLSRISQDFSFFIGPFITTYLHWYKDTFNVKHVMAIALSIKVSVTQFLLVLKLCNNKFNRKFGT